VIISNNAILMTEFVTGRLKKIFKDNRVSVGTWITINSTDVTEALSRVGFDWLVFDTEHAPLTIETAQKLMQPLNGSNVSPIIRVAWNDPVMVKLALDIGPEGILVPWVNNKEQALNAVRACRYPPEGIRGWGPRRAAVYGLDLTYWKRAGDDIALIVQIETREALDNVMDILSTEGVDAFFIGPYDLSVSLGVPLDFESETFKSAIDTALEAGRKTGKPGGIYTSGGQDAVKYLRKGFKMITLTSDISLLLKGAKLNLDFIKSP